MEVHGADSALEKEVLWCGNSTIESKEIFALREFIENLCARLNIRIF